MTIGSGLRAHGVIAALHADPMERRISAEASVPGDVLSMLRDVLNALVKRRPELRGAAIYPMARGGAMVRLFTSRGWIPALVRPADRKDAVTLLARLESALGEAP